MPHIQVKNNPQYTSKPLELKMHYEVKGEGFPLVMIMGLGANLEWWPPRFLDELAKHYQVILLDNRGAGKTEDKKTVYSIPLFARDTINLMDALGIEKAHICGYSMGGMIAQEIALKYPNRVSKLVLSCTNSGFWRGPLFSWDLVKLVYESYTNPKMKRRHFTGKLLFSEDFLKQRDPQLKEMAIRLKEVGPIKNNALFKQIFAISGFSSFTRLRQIMAETLVLSGTQDILMPHQHSKILAKRIKNAKLVELHGRGHGFMIETLDETLKHTLDFLAA